MGFPFEFFEQATNVIVVEATTYTHVTGVHHESRHTFDFAARVTSSANQIVDYLFEAALSPPSQFPVNRFGYIVIKRNCSSHRMDSNKSGITMSSLRHHDARISRSLLSDQSP